jgi:hypothetical protein
MRRSFVQSLSFPSVGDPWYNLHFGVMCCQGLEMFYNEIIIYLFQISHPNEEVNSTQPFPSASVPLSDFHKVPGIIISVRCILSQKDKDS